MKRGGLALGPGKEFDAIRDLLARWGDAASGIGDDASVLDIPRGEKLVVSTDSAVEDRHFRGDWLTPEEIAYRAVTAAISDLAAMAAKPIGVLWAVNLPERWRSRLPSLADGAREAAVAAGAKIVGGNLAASGELAMTTTVIGSAFSPMRRVGAQPGDRIYVTGHLGGPALALDAWLAGREPEPAHRARFARPVARIAEALWLAGHGATSGLDLSDGIGGDARHLAAAGGVGLTLEVDRLPCIEGASPMMGAFGGEEYELLVTAPALDTEAFGRRFGLPLTEIGLVNDGSDVVFLDRGRATEVGGGHDHFVSR